MALTICLGPQPRSHLCPLFASRTAVAATDNDRLDTSSFIQQLCDTASVRNLGHRSKPPLTAQVEGLNELHTLEVSLKIILRTYATRYSSLTDRSKFNLEVSSTLDRCTSWLLRQVPLQELKPWQYVAKEVINEGLTYPLRDNQQPSGKDSSIWLAILDVLNNQRYLRLLRHVVLVIMHKAKMEVELSLWRDDSSSRRPVSQPYAGLLLALTAGERDGRTNSVYALVVWLKRLFVEHWSGEAFLSYSSLQAAILDIIEELHQPLTLDLPTSAVEELFQFPFLVREIDVLSAISHFSRVPDKLEETSKSILSWNLLFSLRDQITYFRTANHQRMRFAHSSAETARMLRRHASRDEDEMPDPDRHYEDHYLLLSVSRSDTLKDTFDQLWQRRSYELLRPLRIRLGEIDALEIGFDLGGVQIEFFNIICRKIFSIEAQMFETDPDTGLSYLYPGSLQPLYMFEMCGLLFALAMYNGITLPVDLNGIFYKQMYQQPHDPRPTFWPLGDFCDSWPTIGKSLKEILDHDIYALDYTFPLEANGLRLDVLMPQTFANAGQSSQKLEIVNATPIMHHESSKAGSSEPHSDFSTCSAAKLESLTDAWPGWHLIPAAREAEPVTLETRQSYVQDYILWKTYGSVAPQLEAFLKGFHSYGVIQHDLLRACFRPNTLQRYVEGSKEVDIDGLRQVTVYEEYEAKEEYIDWFWQILNSWPKEKQKKLLKFVTASERIPFSGAASMTFVIKKVSFGTKEDLPTSSTCFSTLQLPQYGTAEILSHKLSLAVEYGTEGFGTA